jgi:hypothetical protein
MPTLLDISPELRVQIYSHVFQYAVEDLHRLSCYPLPPIMRTCVLLRREASSEWSNSIVGAMCTVLDDEGELARQRTDCRNRENAYTGPSRGRQRERLLKLWQDLNSSLFDLSLRKIKLDALTKLARWATCPGFTWPARQDALSEKILVLFRT